MPFLLNRFAEGKRQMSDPIRGLVNGMLISLALWAAIILVLA
jgi:hypothetical protein